MPIDQLYIGTRKGLFTLERDGKNGWKIADVSFLGTHVPMLLPDPRNGVVYAVAEEGHFGTKLHRRLSGETAWEEIQAPQYPPKPEDAADIRDPIRGEPVPWSLEKIWSLETGGSGEPGRLWAGTIPGGLFSSVDNGQSWALVRSLWDCEERAQWFGGGYDYPGIHSICVDPRDAGHVLAGISCGGVWRTRDGGESWEIAGSGMRADFMPPEEAGNPNIQDPHRLVQCRREPDHLWVQHHCAIYRSTDGALSWHERPNAKPSGFGFAVAVHPEDPLTAWFVPGVKDEVRVPVAGRFVVSRTRDGGETFEVLSQGLPQTHAYHLVYRHGLAVDDSGECLVMGSTTGGLWASEDAGETWDVISQDLPPIYCVRPA